MKEPDASLPSAPVKYTPPGGKILLSLRREQDNLVLDVRDTGAGIEPHDLPRIFDRFYRSRTTANEARGTGLGLAIAKPIVEVHRGNVSVISTPGRGATFTVTLPHTSG